VYNVCTLTWSSLCSSSQKIVKSFLLHRCVLEALDSCSQRIAENAETLALGLYRKENSTENYTTYTYYSNKAYDPWVKPLDYVKILKCTKNRHFYNEKVNTSFSSVHVPTNIYYRGELEHLLLSYLICLLMQSEVNICYVRNEQNNRHDTR
jgi:hypothetical protein